jgi:hypothetical protein
MHSRTIDVKAISALDSDLLAPIREGGVIGGGTASGKEGRVLFAEGFDDLEFWVTV